MVSDQPLSSFQTSRYSDPVSRTPSSEFAARIFDVSRNHVEIAGRCAVMFASVLARRAAILPNSCMLPLMPSSRCSASPWSCFCC